MTVTWHRLLCIIGIFCVGFWSSTSYSVTFGDGGDILSQLRIQELQERSAASRAKQVQYELQVAQAKHAIDRLQHPQAGANLVGEANEKPAEQVVLIGWTQRQGKARFLLRVNERVVRVWEGIRDPSGVLVTQVGSGVQVVLGEQTFRLEIADAQR